MFNNRFAVIGLGRFGSAIARSLADRGAEVLAIDNNETHTEAVKDEVAHAVTLNSTDIKSLKGLNVQEMDAVIVAIGEDFESLLLTSVLLLELEVKRVICRSGSPQQQMILEKVGITETLSPEAEVANTVAETLLRPTMRSFLSLPDDYQIVEINTPRKVANRTVGDIDLRQKYNLNLITIKRRYDEEVEGKMTSVDHIIGVPTGETVLYPDDIIIVLGKDREVERFIEVNK